MTTMTNDRIVLPPSPPTSMTVYRRCCRLSIRARTGVELCTITMYYMNERPVNVMNRMVEYNDDQY